MLVRPIWSVVEYIFNYDYIVETLCENRDKPELQCNGKCYLAKELSDTSDTDKKSPLWSELAKFEIQILHLVDTEVLSLRYFEPIKNNYKRDTQFRDNLFALDILQPPQRLHRK